MTKQTDIFQLIQDADQQLHQKDDAFFKLTDHILQLLRAKKIIPIKRVNENQFLHLVTAGILTSAHLNETSIYMTSRRTNNFVDRGVSTQVIKWLDLMVKHNVLESQMYPKAVGTLTLSEEFEEYLGDYYLTSVNHGFEKVTA